MIHQDNIKSLVIGLVLLVSSPYLSMKIIKALKAAMDTNRDFEIRDYCLAFIAIQRNYELFGKDDGTKDKTTNAQQ